MEKKVGFILINKEKGMTSHDVIDRLREITGIKTIGHSGTLDPLAEGLLILGIGRAATKKLSQFLKKDKEYLAKIRLGAVSDTYDKQGKIEIKENIEVPEIKKIKEIIKSFLGEIKQTPPPFSAKKIKGKRAYQLARKGKKVELKPVKIKIYKIETLNYQFPYLEIGVRCSSGTYIRSLANDIGRKLGCGAYLEELCRTKIGSFSLKEAVFLSQLNSSNWQSFLKELK